MSNLKNTVIVITGASSGIGAASARKVATLGSKVVLAARDEEKLKALSAEIKEAGGEATYYVTNVTDKGSLVGLVEFAIKQYGRIDSLVNNAGLMLFSDWKDVVVDDWEKMIDTNIKGYLYAIAAALPHMLEQGHGKILNMSSVAGLQVGASSGVYISMRSLMTDQAWMKLSISSFRKKTIPQESWVICA